MDDLVPQTCRQVYVCRVPAHFLIAGNQRADSRWGGQSRLTSSFSACPFPYRNLFPRMQSAAQAIWQLRWEALMASTKMEEITYRTFSPWSYNHVRRHSEITLIRLRTNHTHQPKLPHAPRSSALLWWLFSLPDCGTCWSSAPVWGTCRSNTYPGVGGKTEHFVSFLCWDGCGSPRNMVFVFMGKASLLHSI